MKKLLIIITASLLALSFSLSQANAGSVRGQLNVSITVSCNCNVNGVIVPIHTGACVSRCAELQKLKMTENIQVIENGDTKTVIY